MEIDELISLLEVAKARVGGNAQVKLWQDSNHNFDFEKAPSDLSSIEWTNGKGQKGISLEISRTNED
jgi:hypothetical protein